MKIHDSKIKVFMDLSPAVLNELAKRPLYIPKHENEQAFRVVENEDGNGTHKEPLVDFSNSLCIIYEKCMSRLLLTLKDELHAIHEHFGDENTDLESVEAGQKVVTREVQIGMWQFSCALVVVNPKINVVDISHHLDNLFEPSITDYFSLSVSKVQTKPKTFKPTESRNSIERNMTRTK